MTTVNCGICGSERAPEECHVEVLSSQEKLDLLTKGYPPQGRYYYCRPCWKLVNSVQAPKMLANHLESQLRQAGVHGPVAQKIARKYEQRLRDLAEKK